MAGLLDFFGNGWEDPKSNAVMALAGGLLDGDFASGVKGYSQVMAGAKDAQLKRAMQQAQMDNLQSEIEARKLAGTKDARQQALIESVFGGGKFKSNDASVGELSFPMGGMSTIGGGQIEGTPTQLPQQRQQGSILGSLKPDDVARLKLGGLDLTDIYKYANDPQKLEQGATYKDRNNGLERFMPKVGEGMMPNQQGVYGFAPGYAESQAKFEGDKTRAVEAAKAGYSLQEKTLAGGQPVIGTTSQLLEAVQGGNPFTGQPSGQQPAPMQPRQPVQNNASWLSPDAKQGQVDVYESEIRKWTDALKNPNLPPQERDMFTQNLAGVNRELARVGGARPQSLAPNTAPQSAPSFGVQLQSEEQKGRKAAEVEAYKTSLVKTAEANAKNVAPAMMEELFKADDSARAGKSVISTLNEALKLNNDAYSGYGANTRATLVSNLPFESKSANATVKLDNMLKGQALDSMKAIFGSNPTEGERTILLEIQASPDKTPAQRQDIMERAKEAAASRIKFNEEKAKAIRSGTYLNEPLNNEKPKPKALEDYGYKSNDDVLRDAKNTIMRNPQSKAEVERRLQSMGLSLGGR
jgi:hypothetical protein